MVVVLFHIEGEMAGGAVTFARLCLDDGPDVRPYFPRLSVSSGARSFRDHLRERGGTRI